MLRDAVRVLADERIAPRAAEIDRTAEFPWDVKELLASHDILGLPFPEAYGGLGGELLTVCLAIEQISRVCATSGLILAVQELARCRCCSPGSDEQKERWFPDLAAGRKLIAFALTEAEAGSDAAAARTRRRRDGDDWVIDGSKRFISQGSVADLIAVFAVTDEAEDARRATGGSRASSSRRTCRGSPSSGSSTRWASAARRPRSSASAASASRTRTASARWARVSRSRCGRSTGAGPGSRPRRSGSPRVRSRSRPPTRGSGSSSAGRSRSSR